jgi:cysteine desulfurase
VTVRVYADYNAGAPLRPQAAQAMREVMAWAGNPSGAHREGARARRAVETARREVARLVGAEPDEVVFCSGATEANALALRAACRPGAHVVTTAIEHASVAAPLAAAADLGTRVTRVGVDGVGRVDAAGVAAACESSTALLSIGWANGEVGSVAPLEAIVATARARGVPVHSDGAQAAGRLPIDMRRLGIDLVSLSAHKLGGPSGVGALLVRRGTALEPLLRGGPQERGRRAGTENLIGIVGFGAAAAAARAGLSRETERLRGLTEALWYRLCLAVPDVVRNGPREAVLPGTLNVTVPGVSGEALLVLLDMAGVAASLGSACAAGSPEPSHVLRAMGRSEAQARAGLRLSLGWATSADDVDRLGTAFADVTARARAGAAA